MNEWASERMSEWFFFPPGTLAVNSVSDLFTVSRFKRKFCQTLRSNQPLYQSLTDVFDPCFVLRAFVTFEKTPPGTGANPHYHHPQISFTGHHRPKPARWIKKEATLLNLDYIDIHNCELILKCPFGSLLWVGFGLTRVGYGGGGCVGGRRNEVKTRAVGKGSSQVVDRVSEDWSVEELETLPSDTKLRASHNRSPWEERRGKKKRGEKEKKTASERRSTKFGRDLVISGQDNTRNVSKAIVKETSDMGWNTHLFRVLRYLELRTNWTTCVLFPDLLHWKPHLELMYQMEQRISRR